MRAKTFSRVLDALELGELTIPQLTRMLGASESAIRDALDDLASRGAVTTCGMRAEHKFGRPAVIWRLLNDHPVQRKAAA